MAHEVVGGGPRLTDLPGVKVVDRPEGVKPGIRSGKWMAIILALPQLTKGQAVRVDLAGVKNEKRIANIKTTLRQTFRRAGLQGKIQIAVKDDGMYVWRIVS